MKRHKPRAQASTTSLPSFQLVILGPLRLTVPMWTLDWMKDFLDSVANTASCKNSLNLVFKKLIIKHVQMQWGLSLVRTTAGTTCRQVATLTVGWQLQEKKNCLNHLPKTAWTNLIVRCRLATTGLIKTAWIGYITTQRAHTMTTTQRKLWNGKMASTSTISEEESQSSSVLLFV